MLSKRSRLSLCQYLALQGDELLVILLEKHALETHYLGQHGFPALRELRRSLVEAPEAQVIGLLAEILRTQRGLSSAIDDAVYDERWNDLELCLLLDGYRVPRDERGMVTGQPLVLIEPTIEGAESPEDDLETELTRSGLPRAGEVQAMLEDSATAFREARPNDCLTNARVALQTLATDIALARRAGQGGTFDERVWGQVAAYLRASGLISEDEEKGVCGVYSFLSPGAHVPVGLDQQDVARLGRSLAAHMCYFLAKRYNG